MIPSALRSVQYTSESFHFELATVFLQPQSLVRVFFWDRLLPLLAGGGFTIVEAMDESEGVSGGQQTDLVAEVITESLFERGLRKMKLRIGYFDTLELA